MHTTTPRFLPTNTKKTQTVTARKEEELEEEGLPERESDRRISSSQPSIAKDLTDRRPQGRGGRGGGGDSDLNRRIPGG